MIGFNLNFPFANDILDCKHSNEPLDGLVVCPLTSVDDLSPEQYKTVRQIYQAAYKQARLKVVSHQVECHRLGTFGLGDGI